MTAQQRPVVGTPVVATPVVATPVRILDAAESLFAARGFDDVSVRSITNEAEVRLNLLWYHFGSKEQLFEAVVDRRLAVINDHRRDALAALAARLADEGRAGSQTVAEVLDAFIRPYVELAVRGGPGWPAYTRLIAQICLSDRHAPMVREHMSETLALFHDAFTSVLPGASQADLEEGFGYAITLMLASFTGLLHVDRLVRSADGTEGGPEAVETVVAPLVTYAAAGLLALCGRS